MSSDHSDSEEIELWARTVDLPGFDDNVSPHNTITMLLRFVVGEVVVNLARSSNRVDKPYLLLRLGKLCWDSALMEYGPAVQASVGSVRLVDRLHAAPGGTGQYLEMVSTEAGADDDVLTMLYRKVRGCVRPLRHAKGALGTRVAGGVVSLFLVRNSPPASHHRYAPGSEYY